MEYFKNIANIDDLKNTFRELSKKLHPDINLDIDPNLFIEMSRQYEAKLKSFTEKDTEIEFTIPENVNIDLQAKKIKMKFTKQQKKTVSKGVATVGSVFIESFTDFLFKKYDK